MFTSRWTEKSPALFAVTESRSPFFDIIDGSDSESLDIESDDDDCFV